MIRSIDCLPDINRTTANGPGGSMVLGGRMKGMEHVPIRLHDLSKKNAIVSHCCYVNRMRHRISRVKVIGSSHNRRLFRTEIRCTKNSNIILVHFMQIGTKFHEEIGNFCLLTNIEHLYCGSYKQ